MKVLLFILVIISVSSCTSLKYNAKEDSDNYKNIKAGNKYTFHRSDGCKIPMTITSIAKDSIIGTRKKERISIAKRDIREIRKDKTAIAVAITSGGIAAAAVIIAGMSKATEDLADTAAAFGSGLN